MENRESDLHPPEANSDGPDTPTNFWERGNAVEPNINAGTLDALPAAWLTHGFLIDSIQLGSIPGTLGTFKEYKTNRDCEIWISGPSKFEIWSYHFRVVSGDKPTVCPNAEPTFPVTRLPALVDRLRTLKIVCDGQTIHWHGEQASIDTLCQCFLAEASVTTPAVRLANEACEVREKSPRLRVENGARPLAILDGTACEVPHEVADLLEALIDADGQPVNMGSHGVRSRQIAKLPGPLCALIKRATGKGCWIPRELLWP